MTFDKQSNGRRTTVESKSNRRCNHSVNDLVGLRYSGVARPSVLLTEFAGTNVKVVDGDVQALGGGSCPRLEH